MRPAQDFRENKSDIIVSYQINANDCGSAAVQIALLTNHIVALTDHLKVHKKDTHCRHSLLKKVGYRRRLLKYLKRTNRTRFDSLTTDLNIKTQTVH